MAAPYTALSQLKYGRTLQRVVARLLRFWDARNIKKGGQLMGVDLLLIDEKSTMVQGSIHLHQLPKFQDGLSEGKMYVITAFEVVKSNPRFKLTDSTFSIRFNDSTTMVELEDSFCEIPKELFRFRSHEQLVSLANTNNELPDVIGQLCESKAYHNEATKSLERMLVHLQLQSGERVRLSAFDEHANTLKRRMEKKEDTPCVLLATSINPKLFGGHLYLNATSGTKFFFDEEAKASREFSEKLKLIDENEGNRVVEKYRGVQKIEQVSIAELTDYIVTSNTQDAEFLCTARVVDIEGHNGWTFIACSNCGRKMVKIESSLACHNCYSPTAVGNLRYRVELLVDDGINCALFVVFDKDMFRLMSTTAKSLAAQMAENPEEKEAAIPKELSTIVGKEFTFHIKLTPFNFTSRHRSFTVARIFDNPQEAPTPTFAEDIMHPTKQTGVTASTSGSGEKDAKESSVAKKPKLK